MLLAKIPTLLLVALPLFSQVDQRPNLSPIPRVEVRRATGKIMVDGKPNDSAWKDAAVVEFQFPWDFQTGAKQKTTARLLWDDDNLYIAYDCEDSDVVAHYDKRDDPTYKDDAVEIFIYPGKNRNLYYGLEMNARGTLYDYFYIFPQLLMKRLDLVGVQLATNIRGTLNMTSDKDQGWTLEVAIPWKNFEELGTGMPPKPGDIWRANLNRWDGTEPNRRLSQWSDSGMTKANPHWPERFGELLFVK